MVEILTHLHQYVQLQEYDEINLQEAGVTEHKGKFTGYFLEVIKSQRSEQSQLSM